MFLHANVCPMVQKAKVLYLLYAESYMSSIRFAVLSEILAHFSFKLLLFKTIVGKRDIAEAMHTARGMKAIALKCS